MRRRLFTLVTVLLLTCMVFAVPASAKIVDQSVTGTYHQTEARKMLDIVNDFRTGSEAFYINQDNTTTTAVPNLGKLSWDYDLEKAAMQRAAELIVSYSHTRPDGTSCFTALSDVNSVFLMGCGENIAYGSSGWYFDTAQQMFDGWKEDGEPYSGQGHRRNMLKRDFKTIGIACIQANGCNYWAMELSSGSSGAAATTANDSLTSVNVKTFVESAEDWGSNLDMTMDTLDGGTVSTAANGKAKVLIFTYNTGCWNSNNVIRQLYNLNLPKEMADIYICSAWDYSDTAEWRNEFGTSSNLVWCYNTGNVRYNYGHKFSAWSTTPMIVYIDSANNIKGSTTGNVDILSEMRQRLGLYEIAYNANGGSGAPATQYKNIDVTLTLSTKTPTRSGYTFAGWNTAADGSGTAYSAGQSYTRNSGATLYAQWKASDTLKITSQPKNAYLALGATGKFTVAATGTGLTYQWQYKSATASAWTNSGNSTAKKATLEMTADSTRNGMQFRCIVKNASGKSVTSDPATMTIKAAITAQPKNVNLALGETGKFTVTAVGTGLTYQWQYKSATASAWTNSGNSTAKTATLEMKADSTRNGMQFRCIVKDSAGTSVTSSPATMTILEKLSISAQPKNVTLALGATGKFTVAATGTGLTYQWQYKSATATTWTNSGNSTAKKATLEMTADSTRNGMQFRCIVKDASGKSVISNAATMTIKAAITAQPKNVTLALGDTGKFSVTAVGTGLTYQWQYKSATATTWTNSGNSTAKTATLEMKADSTRNGMQFRCIVKDSAGNSVTSSAATMTVVSGLTITAQPKNVTLALGATGKFTVAATGTGLTYQWQYKSATATTWTNSGNSTAKTATLEMTADSTRNGMQFRCIVKDASGKSVTSNAATMTIKAAITAQPKNVTLALGATGKFSVTAVGTGLTYQWQYKSATASAWTNSGNSTAKTATLEMKADSTRNGMQFRCIVKDSAGNTATSNAATMTVVSGLSITAQPVDRRVMQGYYGSFSVEASGTGLSYRWQCRAHNSSAWTDCSASITGYHDSTIYPEASADRSGMEFRCIIKDAYGNTVTSDAATLNLQYSDFQLNSQTSRISAPVGMTVEFRVGSIGTGLRYQWQYQASGTTSWTNAAFDGSKTDTLSVSVTAVRNNYRFRCRITDNMGRVIYSDPALLEVAS